MVQEGAVLSAQFRDRAGVLGWSRRGSRVHRNPVPATREACWVRGSLAWLFCLICDLVHPEGVAELGLPVGGECPSVCVRGGPGQPVWGLVSL